MFTRRILPIIALIAGLGIAYVAFDWAVGAVIHNRTVVPVPDVVGKSAAEALTILSQAKLGISKDGEQFDKGFPAGTVLRQTPASGTNVREGRTVRVVVSQGGETLFVPNVVGQPLRNAQTALQNAGLGLGEIEHRPSLRFEKDQVMATDPAGGAAVSKNALISMILSEGPPDSDVVLTPDFIGKSLSEVKEWAASRQISLSTRGDSDPTKPKNSITMQSPTADSSIRAGDQLTVVVNSGEGTEGPHVHFELPQGNGDRDVKIIVIDESGEHEVYRKAHAPGSVIDMSVPAKGRARARVFVNGILTEEQEIQ